MFDELRHILKRSVVVIAAVGLATGCSSMMSSATVGLADSLTNAVLDQNDPETVRQGAPAYLLLIDGLIADNPNNVDLLLAGASLYSSYAGAFVDDPERAARLSLKGRDYGWAALCRGNKKACGIWTAPYEDFERVINGMGSKDVPILYGSGAAWASWIRANTDDWSAIADKARVDAIMQRVVALDETYEDGSAFLYLGILATLLPELGMVVDEDVVRHLAPPHKIAESSLMPCGQPGSPCSPRGIQEQTESGAELLAVAPRPQRHRRRRSGSSDWPAAGGEIGAGGKPPRAG